MSLDNEIRAEEQYIPLDFEKGGKGINMSGRVFGWYYYVSGENYHYTMLYDRLDPGQGTLANRFDANHNFVIVSITKTLEFSTTEFSQRHIVIISIVANIANSRRNRDGLTGNIFFSSISCFFILLYWSNLFFSY